MNKTSMIALMMTTLLAASMPLAVAHDNCAATSFDHGVVSGRAGNCVDAHDATIASGGFDLVVNGRHTIALWNVPNAVLVPDCFSRSESAGSASVDYGFCIPLDLNGPVLVSSGGADVVVGSERFPVRWLDIENPLHGILP